jgi:FtsH-binding integral membrane protein
LVFSALNAYDHQQIKQQALQEGDDEGMAIMSSVGLYINFLNLFTAFMHLLGVRE